MNVFSVLNDLGDAGVFRQRARHRAALRVEPRHDGLEPMEPRLLFSAAPMAGDDLLTPTQDTALTVDDLLLNDTDADGHTLSVLSHTSAGHGLVTRVGNSFTYTPDPGFLGRDAFTYTVGDGVDGQDVAVVNISVNAPIDADATRDALLAGVSQLSDPGSPGEMVAFGPNAINIANFPGSDWDGPMIAAGTMGQGRVVALGDHQWLRMDSEASEGAMGTFYTNSLSWLAGTTDKSIRIVVAGTNDSGSVSWLQSQGFTNVVQTSNYVTGLAGADVLTGWLGHNVSQANLDAITDFVHDGGGIMLADYGQGYQGHYGWWPGEVYEAAGNQVLREAGIGFASGTHSGDGLTVTEAGGQLTAQDVLDMLENPSGYSQAQLDEGGAMLGRLIEVLAPGDILLARLDASFWQRIGQINPTPDSPVSDAFDQALLSREMSLIRDLPPEEVTAHRTAEAVYGAIPPDAPRLSNHVVTLDASTTGMIATGMYAAPGELVKITVPSAMVGEGYRIRISGHKDNISRRSSWDRVPFGVSRVYDLDAATIQVAGAFGGQIYIDMGGESGGDSSGLGSQDIIIDGAIAAPIFILGQTTNAQWVSSIRDNPAPYAEFVSDHLAFSVPASWVRTLDDPTALMTLWDETVAFQDWVTGIENIRTGPERINVDVQISVGLLHAGYPIQGPTWASADLVDYQELVTSGTWGYFHELGHEMQRMPALGWGWNNPWTFSGDVEVTVNIAANAALEFAAPLTGTQGWGWSAHPDEVMSRALETLNDPDEPDFDQKNPYPFYFQLADGFGWDTYRAVLGSYVSDAQNNPDALPESGQEEKDQWLIRWSQHSGYNMVDYMVNRWGLEVSGSAINTVNAMSLPTWLPATSTLLRLRAGSSGSVTANYADTGVSLDGVATLVSVGAAAHGTLTDNGDGTYTYSADAGFQGLDRFEVVYRSSAGNTMASQVLVDVDPAASSDFESGFGEWVNITGDSHDWDREAGGTPSNSTGPSGGANGSNWYVYLEASSAGGGAYHHGDTAILQSGEIVGSQRVLTFDYHMYGRDMGTLNVDVFSGGVWDHAVWSRTGQQHTSSGAEFTQATVDLGAYSGPIQVRFRAVAAGGSKGDMALDNIAVSIEPGLAGDINNDGVVGIDDLQQLLIYWGQAATASPGALAADLNQDGTVNTPDLDIVRNNYGRTTPESIGATQPTGNPDRSGGTAGLGGDAGGNTDTSSGATTKPREGATPARGIVTDTSRKPDLPKPGSPFAPSQTPDPATATRPKPATPGPTLSRTPDTQRAAATMRPAVNALALARPSSPTPASPDTDASDSAGESRPTRRFNALMIQPTGTRNDSD